MRHLIQDQPDMEVVGEADDGSAVQGLVEKLQPDILVIDLSMPEMSGVEAIRRLKAAHSTCKALVLTVHEDRSYLRELLEAGALGYMLKRASGDELIRAIRAIAAGSVHIDSRVADKLISSLVEKSTQRSPGTETLTGREEHVLRSIAEGYSIKEIAATLDISVKTVETYKARGMEKLGLRSRVDIVRMARERGWLGKLDRG
jgi:DNA-binding NarL/FixJ family response regulator